MYKEIDEDDHQMSKMDLDEFRAILSKSKTDVWSVIDAAIMVASLDHSEELKNRRDKIVEKLYLCSCSSGRKLCRSCENNTVVEDQQQENNKSPLTPESNHIVKEDNDDEEVDPFNGLFDDDEEELDEQGKILKIRDRLQDLNQSDDCLIESLQELADMDITYTALQETDIGRHVNRFRKHPAAEVRTLVKVLVRKWKEVVDEWVQSGQHSEDFLADGDSPQQNVRPISQDNGHYKGTIEYSPNPPNGGSSSEKKYSEPEVKTKPGLPRGVGSSRPQPSAPKSISTPKSAVPPRPRESGVDLDRLDVARKRLQENYQEAENAKKQRTIQVMDIHDIPKPKNKGIFFAKNKGGFQGRNNR